MRSGGEMGKVDVAKAAVRSTSPGRTTAGEGVVAGALNASAVDDATMAASKLAMAVVVFMMMLLLL